MLMSNNIRTRLPTCVHVYVYYTECIVHDTHLCCVVCSTNASLLLVTRSGYSVSECSEGKKTIGRVKNEEIKIWSPINVTSFSTLQSLQNAQAKISGLQYLSGISMKSERSGQSRLHHSIKAIDNYPCTSWLSLLKDDMLSPMAFS